MWTPHCGTREQGWDEPLRSAENTTRPVTAKEDLWGCRAGGLLGPRDNSACQGPSCKASAADTSAGQPGGCQGPSGRRGLWLRVQVRASWLPDQGWKAAACVPVFMACQLRMVFTVLKERKRGGEYATECVWSRKPEMLFVLCGPFHLKGAEPCARGSVSERPLGAPRGAWVQGHPRPLLQAHFSDPEHRGPSCHCTQDGTTSRSPLWC